MDLSRQQNRLAASTSRCFCGCVHPIRWQALHCERKKKALASPQEETCIGILVRLDEPQQQAARKAYRNDPVAGEPAKY